MKNLENQTIALAAIYQSCYIIKEIAEHYVDAVEVAQVIYNLNTHKAGSLYEAFTAEEAKQTHSGSFRVRLHA